jgi:hypothetical protein
VTEEEQEASDDEAFENAKKVGGCLFWYGCLPEALTFGLVAALFVTSSGFW